MPDAKVDQKIRDICLSSAHITPGHLIGEKHGGGSAENSFPAPNTTPAKIKMKFKTGKFVEVEIPELPSMPAGFRNDIASQLAKQLKETAEKKNK